MTLLTNKRKLDRILKLIREVKSSLYNPIRLFVKVMIIKLLRKDYLFVVAATRVIASIVFFPVVFIPELDC